MKSMSKLLLSGKSIINISLPVRIFEARSFLERITDTWCYAPLFLRRASLACEPIERLKWVVTFVISGLHRGVKQMKPFNPILGETWQAKYRDGTQLYFEQTSHHPPISSFQVFGPNNLYYLWGYHEYTASFSSNGIIGGQVGPNNVQFSDGTRITYQNPYVQLTGMVWGDRLFNWIDKGIPLQFIDEKNNLRCELKFNPDALTGLKSLVSTAKTPSDQVRGIITNITPKQGTVLCEVEGSWLEGLKFNNKSYWINREYEPFFPIPADEIEVLPSDSRYRPDLIFLRRGDTEAAQISKAELENTQRRDRKLRKDLHKRNK